MQDTYPVTDLTGDDLDDADARVVLVAFVNAVVEVAEVARVVCAIPVLLDELPVLRQRGDPVVGYPARGGGVKETAEEESKG